MKAIVCDKYGRPEKGNSQVVLDKTFPFEQIVDAHRYAESGSKKGNIAIQMKYP